MMTDSLIFFHEEHERKSEAGKDKHGSSPCKNHAIRAVAIAIMIVSALGGIWIASMPDV